MATTLGKLQTLQSFLKRFNYLNCIKGSSTHVNLCYITDCCCCFCCFIKDRCFYPSSGLWL